MRYAYYPGCSSESSARDQHTSSVAVARSLGIDLVEIPGWSCCGATPAHQTDRILASSLPAANLLKARDMGLDVVVNCAACYNRLKTANHEVQNQPEMRKKVATALGRDYDGSVKVRHIVEVLLEDFGVKNLKTRLRHSLNGLKIASYYGCLLVRPHEVTQFDDPENPQSVDTLVTALGGESLDWPCKVSCCGNSLSLTTRSDLVVEFSDAIIGMASAAGADCIAVACPLCQVNLDLRQSDIQKKTGRNYQMPVLYITQLIGLCLGLSFADLGLEKLVVSPSAVIRAVNNQAKQQRA
ncbi:MAG: CoB--CoM heterodisulfide reductase iron-sulfur subunit B family protein [Desulfosalsimonadaceae bacterium]|nr:CoB--CoM heterodisulfide reductase iron-sulfur subunit B family protein [Desulfosalsimonadaceae bacterium]